MVLGGSESCLSCHREGGAAASGIASFEAHVEDVERMHKVRFDRGRIGGACVYCHDPHLLE
jgi:hypothetical protein